METWLPLEVNTAISLCSGPGTVTEPRFTRTTGNSNVFDDLFNNTSQNEKKPAGL